MTAVPDRISDRWIIHQGGITGSTIEDCVRTSLIRDRSEWRFNLQRIYVWTNYTYIFPREDNDRFDFNECVMFKLNAN